MKKILVIDDSDLFRDFIAQKLTGLDFEVVQASNGFEGMMKIRSTSPDLVIMDYFLSRNSAIEILEKKAQDPNLRQVPVIMASTNVDRESLLRVSVFGVKKFFTKPVRIDAFIKAVAEALNIKLAVDETPCIIEANYNEEIIIIEVAQGLNKDKIDLLKYRLQELLSLYKIEEPRVLLLLTGLEVGANDSLTLASLISNIVEFSQARLRNIKVLTTSEFVKRFLKSRDTYVGIEAVADIQEAMDALLGSKASSFKEGEAQTVSSDFLKSTAHTEASSVNMRFQGEVDKSKGFDLSEIGQHLRIALVDDDPVIRALMTKAFESLKAAVVPFEDGAPFLEALPSQKFDLVFLDLLMPTVDGFKVLQDEVFKAASPSVVVLSALSKRETVERALKLGVKSYIIKPVTPDRVLNKTAEILRSNF